MSHELTVNKVTGKGEMFYVGQSPWHSLGNPFPRVATTEEAIEASGMGWTVSLQPLYRHRDGQAYESRLVRSVVRDDTHEEIGSVGMDYTLFQNREMFEFCDTLVGESAAMYHTAGSLRGGSRVWVLAKLPQNLVVVPGDEVEKYFLLASGHDGGLSLTARFTDIRVVCANTLSAALSEPGAKWEMKVRHTQNVKDRVEEARKVLQVGLRYFEVLGRKYQALAAATIDAMMAQQYFEAVIPITKTSKDEDSPRIKRTHEILAYLFQEGRGNQLPGVKNTMWAALNAVSEYVDHVRGVRRDGVPRETWAEAALFGSGMLLKQKAFTEALAFVGAKR